MVQVGGPTDDRPAGQRVDDVDRVELVGFVFYRWRVAATLLRQAVHEHRATEPARDAQGVLQCADVVTIDGADVLQAEVFEHDLRLQQVLHALLHAVQRLVERLSDEGRASEGVADQVEHLLVGRREPKRREMRRQAADGRGIRAAVVVDDDHKGTMRPAGDGVERLPAHAARQRAVADDRNDRTILLAPDVERLRQPVGV